MAEKASEGEAVASDGSAQEVTVELSGRSIMSPFAAKRLSLLPNNVVQQYEARLGSLEPAD